MHTLPVLALFLLVSGPVLGRTVEFVYSVEIPPETPGGEIALWLPLADQGAAQAVDRREIRATLPGLVRHDRRHGNLFWAGRTHHRQGNPLRVEVRYRIVRRGQGPAAGVPVPDGDYLRPDAATPVDHARVTAMLAGVEVRDPSPPGRVRALYDFVIASMREARVGSGWGRADGFWAAEYTRGDDSDFAALFVALARSWEVPARLRFGVCVPPDSRGGRVAPCTWAEFYLEEAGWLPIDPAAARRSGHHDAYFGRLPADRLLLWTGRGTALAGAAAPPGFLLEPHVELDGRPLKDVVVTRYFREP